MRILTCLAASAVFTASLNASAAVLRFDDSATQISTNEWVYEIDGVQVQATVISENGRIFYNPVEDAIGVGTNVLNGAMSWGETLTIRFDQPVTISQISFRQWENPGLIFTYDEVIFRNDDTGGLLTLTDSGQGAFDLLDHFALPDITLSSFTLIPNNQRTAVYLWGIEFETTEIPLPGAVWLFGTALAGLGVAGRRRTVEV